MKPLLAALVVSISLLAGCAPAAAPTQEVGPTYTLWFDTANRIHRTLVENESRWQPTWVIIQNGDVVLERSAMDEAVYTYFKDEPGIYTVYLKAWTGESYEVASNVVSYQIE